MPAPSLLAPWPGFGGYCCDVLLGSSPSCDARAPKRNQRSPSSSSSSWLWRPSSVMGAGNTDLALQSPDEHAVKDLSCLVAVSDVLERLGGILSTDIEHDLLATSVPGCQSLSCTCQKKGPNKSRWWRGGFTGARRRNLWCCRPCRARRRRDRSWRHALRRRRG